MFTSETVFIASKLENLISGNLESSDIVRAKNLPDEIEGLAKKIIDGSPSIPKIKNYKYKNLVEILDTDPTIEDSLQMGENLIKNTDFDFVDLMPKVDEVRELLKSMLPNSVIEDVYGISVQDPSIRDQISFIRLFGAVDNPLSVLMRISDNSFTDSEMSIIRQVYPELLEGFTNMLLAYITDKSSKNEKTLGHTKSIGIRRFLGENINSKAPQAIDEEQAQKSEQQIKMGDFEAGNRMLPERDREL